MQQNIAFFDFDGTITRKDTMFELVKFSHGKTGFYKGLLQISPWLVALKLGLVSAQKAKEQLLREFYGNWSIQKFNAVCEAFTNSILPSIIRRDAMECIEQHKAAGTKVVVVSASAENWIAPWCALHDIECIGSRLQIQAGKLTGKLEGNNCNGPEKVNRILLAYDPAQYDIIYCYGDTAGDKELLALAQQPYYRMFTK